MGGQRKKMECKPTRQGGLHCLIILPGHLTKSAPIVVKLMLSPPTPDATVIKRLTSPALLLLNPAWQRGGHRPSFGFVHQIVVVHLEVGALPPWSSSSAPDGALLAFEVLLIFVVNLIELVVQSCDLLAEAGVLLL